MGGCRTFEEAGGGDIGVHANGEAALGPMLKSLHHGPKGAGVPDYWTPWDPHLKYHFIFIS